MNGSASLYRYCIPDSFATMETLIFNQHTMELGRMFEHMGREVAKIIQGTGSKESAKTPPGGSGSYCDMGSTLCFTEKNTNRVSSNA